MIDLDAVIERTEGLVALPESAMRLARIFADQGWDLDEVSDTIRLDPLLFARVLRLANSAKGGGQGVKTASAALMRLGRGQVLALALGAASRDALLVGLPCYGLEAGQLWRHSVAVSLAVELAGKHTDQSVPEEAFGAALLHEIGVLPLSEELAGQVLQFVERSRTEGHNAFPDAELEVLGTHHGELAGLLASRWQLPAPLVEGMVYHHMPEQAPSEAGRRVAGFVFLGDAVAERVGAGSQEPPPPWLQRKRELRKLGIGPDQFTALCAEVQDNLDEVLERYA